MRMILILSENTNYFLLITPILYQTSIQTIFQSKNIKQNQSKLVYAQILTKKNQISNSNLYTPIQSKYQIKPKQSYMSKRSNANKSSNFI